MKSEFLSAAVQFVFGGEGYDKGKKARILNNVKEKADAGAVAKVGQELAKLQGDTLLDATLIERQTINLSEAE